MKSKNFEKRVIIIIGPPGAGKGTQAYLLARELEMYHFETSKILEEKFAKSKRGEVVKVGKEKYDIKKEHKIWVQGKLCSPPFVAYLVSEKIQKLFKQDQSIIFSGSPRTLYEGKKIIPLLKELYKKKNIKVIFLDISPRETLYRNFHRRICQLVRHPILYLNETKNLKRCPLDGSKLLKRKGLDDPKTIKTRLKEYKERTLPLINYFKKEGLEVVKISGSPPPVQVFKNILKVLKIKK
jgi:adenylate kinase